MTLYVVATPIGNLEDMTYRAVSVLGGVDVIFAEDTRVVRKLLDAYDIATPAESFHARSEAQKAERVIELLHEGKDVALVSDAGTPALSDPGSFLIRHVREAAPDISIVPIPGPSALTAALSVSGFPVSSFVFYGFLPHKKGRQTKLHEIGRSEQTSVLFESPHRIQKLLGELSEVVDLERRVCIARELTKIYEEVRVGSAEELRDYLVDNPEKNRGEFVVLIEGA